jgi:ABC-type transporter Mla maintaining outer membrane lipid asymmetry permease subunit MlaE
MHSPSPLWLVAPFMSLIIGFILASQGLWRSAQPNSVGKELSNATIFRARAILVSSGLFLTVLSALLAFGLMKR